MKIYTITPSALSYSSNKYLWKQILRIKRKTKDNFQTRGDSLLIVFKQCCIYNDNFDFMFSLQKETR